MNCLSPSSVWSRITPFYQQPSWSSFCSLCCESNGCSPLGLTQPQCSECSVEGAASKANPSLDTDQSDLRTWHFSFQMPLPFNLPKAQSILSKLALSRPQIEWWCQVPKMCSGNFSCFSRSTKSSQSRAVWRRPAGALRCDVGCSSSFTNCTVFPSLNDGAYCLQ